MELEAIEDAALRGFDLGETVTLPYCLLPNSEEL
jgi:hypothetical protein